MTAPTDADQLRACHKLASGHGMYIIVRQEVRHGKTVTMFLLFRRLRFGFHGTMIGKRNSLDGLWKLINKAKEVK